MIGRPTLAEAERGEGETVTITIHLDPESRRILRELPTGFGGAFVRKSIAAFVDWLDAHADSPARPPRQIPSGEFSIFAMKAPAGLLERARAHVGQGKTYTTLSGLVRTAIHWKGGRR